MTATSKATETDEGSSVLSRALAELDAVQASDGERIVYLTDVLADEQRMRENLEAALVNSRRIGAAVGIMMAVLKVTEDDAFAVLARISQTQNRKLRLVADDVVLTGSS